MLVRLYQMELMCFCPQTSLLLHNRVGVLGRALQLLNYCFPCPLAKSRTRCQTHLKRAGTRMAFEEVMAEHSDVKVELDHLAFDQK